MKNETPSDHNRNWKCLVFIFLLDLVLLLIKPISCSYLSCKLKSHFISFSLQASAVGSIKHELQRNTSKLYSLVWNVHKDRAPLLSFNLLIGCGVYLSCSHCIRSVFIFLCNLLFHYMQLIDPVFSWN